MSICNAESRSQVIFRAKSNQNKVDFAQNCVMIVLQEKAKLYSNKSSNVTTL